MASIQSKISEIYSLESLSNGDTCIHKISTTFKLAITFVYIIAVVSCGKNIFVLSVLSFYPFVVTALAEIPFKLIFRRACLALPFCIFAGLSFLIFGSDLTHGIISFFALIIRCVLCVWAVLIPIATTPFCKIVYTLRRLHVPQVFALLFEMTYRYISILLDEASSMVLAYKIRSGANSEKGIALKDTGTFVAQLFLRSFDRAGRVYDAMKCRGYASE